MVIKRNLRYLLGGTSPILVGEKAHMPTSWDHTPIQYLASNIPRLWDNGARSFLELRSGSFLVMRRLEQRMFESQDRSFSR